MTQDIVPELNKAIETSFRSRMSRDSRVRAITKRMDAGIATLADMHDYSVRVGENLSGALRSNITADILPNETLYYNIADRTVRPALQTGYDLINDAAAATQKAIDASNGIGINSVRAPFPDGRVDGLIDRMTHEVTLEDALEWLAEPIINNAEAFFDDFVRENAKTSAQMGLKCTIRRETSANACDWCAELEGTYEYGDEPKDIYRRHAFCRCQVTLSREKGEFQDVWSKKWYNQGGGALDRQIEKGSDSKALMAKERLAKLPQGKNVTPEYYKTAAPGTGIISREAGYKEKIHADEIKTAELLHSQFGGNITLLTESNTDKQKTADYLWNGKLWELKTPTSTKATDNSVRRGLKQIADNPGGIILNYENVKVNTTDIESVIEGRMRRGREQSADIMIIKNDVVEKVIRYGK